MTGGPSRGSSYRAPGLPWVVGGTFPWVEYVKVAPTRYGPREFVATVVEVSAPPGGGLIVRYQETPGGPTGCFWAE